MRILIYGILGVILAMAGLPFTTVGYWAVMACVVGVDVVATCSRK